MISELKHLDSNTFRVAINYNYQRTGFDELLIEKD